MRLFAAVVTPPQLDAYKTSRRSPNHPIVKPDVAVPAPRAASAGTWGSADADATTPTAPALPLRLEFVAGLQPRDLAGIDRATDSRARAWLLDKPYARAYATCRRRTRGPTISLGDLRQHVDLEIDAGRHLLRPAVCGRAAASAARRAAPPCRHAHARRRLSGSRRRASLRLPAGSACQSPPESPPSLFREPGRCIALSDPESVIILSIFS